ncbi:DUF1003 domain-containing protein [Streptomyces sp. URMC 123]|uniref:DUF1003 domain-containing protein n=1 Tax=Streptomyces sp. URMC 123 TaxID=3423403 RepID=UPI003F1A5C3D
MAGERRERVRAAREQLRAARERRDRERAERGHGERERVERERAERERAERERAEHRRIARLDQPRSARRGLLTGYDPDAFGRLSERIARFLGTGRFIVWMSGVIVLWVLWNITAPERLRFDEYPFIFLTLALSLQASYAAPLILLAQNRQADRDRVNLEQDRARHELNIAATEYLTREVAALRLGQGEVATRDWLRSELQVLAKDLVHELGDGEEPRVFPAEGARRREERDR